MLKTFIDDTRAEYESEVEAYDKLRVAMKNQHIITFYGSYTHMDTNNITTHNIIMELADEGDLERYFKRPPPSESRDITTFWTSLLGILKALHAIHNIEVKSSNGASRWSNGFVTNCICLIGRLH